MSQKIVTYLRSFLWRHQNVNQKTLPLGLTWYKMLLTK